MKFKLFTAWERLSGSFWFLPALMVLAAILLAVGLTAIDEAHPDLTIPVLPGIYSGNPQGARSLLSTIAGSMISVAGLTFSITIASLSLASTQFGPRLLDNFMRDRGNQIVLGTFVAIFIYCLLVLRTVRGSDTVTFVPHLSITLALGLAVISLGVLIFFFHHVSTMIQAQNVVASIGRELSAAIERLSSIQPGETLYEYALRGEDDIPANFDDNSRFITARSSGYLQTLDNEALQTIATRNDLLLRLFYRPGNFIAEGSEIVAVYPAEGLSDEAEKDIHDAFALGAGRLRIQDVEYAIDQLVEIAVRALSPGINDPFTAIACLDQFSTTLSRLAKQTIPSGYSYDIDGNLRMISDAVTFAGLINASFDQIRQYGKSDVAVTIRLLEVIAIILARATTTEQKDALVRQADMIKRASEEAIPEANDRQDVDKRYELVMRILNKEQDVANP
jgi:uncharacterized membrane protein